MKRSKADAVCLWHLLDQVLPRLREARDEFAEAGLEDEAGVLAEVVEKAEFKYAKAEKEVARLLDGEAG